MGRFSEGFLGLLIIAAGVFIYWILPEPQAPLFPDWIGRVITAGAGIGLIIHAVKRKDPDSD